MACLEDKILGEKGDYYCSSSEDEEEKQTAQRGGGGTPSLSSVTAQSSSSSSVSTWRLHPSKHNANRVQNTGPKGVLADWRRFKQLESENREKQQAEMYRLAQKLSLTCRTDKEDERAKLAAEQEELELDELEDDDFMRQFMQKRMAEMKAAVDKHQLASFGKLYDIGTADEFLSATDKTATTSTVIMLIYEEAVPGCESMIGCMRCLAEDYPQVKFCKVKASAVGASKRFRNLGVPTLQAYRNGDLIANFVRLTDDLGEDFFADEVENFLKDYGILPELNSTAPATLKSSLSRQSRNSRKDSDSDFDID